MWTCCFRTAGRTSESPLTEANAHISGMRANLGGTEILRAIEAAFNQPRPTSMARQIVVVTDGEVTNTDAVIAFVRTHQAYARVFTFGIGAGPSHHLVHGLARAGGGAAEFILPGERASAKILRQLARVLSPALTNVRLDWSGLSVTQAPLVVPPIFGGGRLLVYGFLKTPREGRQPTTIRLEADSASGPLTFDVSVDPAQATDRTCRTLATLAARSRIRELEEHPDWIGARGSKQTDRKTSAHVKEIIGLSLRYGLMSRETSYVAVERRESPVVGDVQLRRIPVALTRGWGNVASRLQVARIAGCRRSSQCGHPPGSLDLSDTQALMVSLESAGEAVMPSRPTGRMASRFPRLSAASRPAHHGLQALIALQHADGSWELNDELAGAIGLRLRDIEKWLKRLARESALTRQAWATALSVAWLEKNAADTANEWRLLAQKAERWLEGVRETPSSGESWFEAARTALARPPA